jgi:hypothetical protein
MHIQTQFVMLPDISRFLAYTNTFRYAPGFSPFYCLIPQSDLLLNFKDLRVHWTNDRNAGGISNPTQYSWSQLLPRPPRSIKSRSTHIFVIEPDHFCGWVGTWIGKQNINFFQIIQFLRNALQWACCSVICCLHTPSATEHSQNCIWSLHDVLFTLINAPIYDWIVLYQPHVSSL